MLVGMMNDPNRELLSEIEFAGEHSFEFFELTIEYPGAMPDSILQNRKKISDILSSYNLPVLGHMAWYFSIAHPYPSIQKAIIGEINSAIDAAVPLKIKQLTLHPEFLSSITKDRSLLISRSIATLNEVSDSAKSQKCELLFENFNDTALSEDEFARILDGTKLNCTFDIGHANMNGRNGSGIYSFLSRFSKKIRHVHAHDNFGKEDSHLPIGAGQIDWAKAIPALKSYYNGTITLEVHSKDRSLLLHSKEKLQAMWHGKKQVDADKDYLQPEMKKQQ